MQNDVGRAVKMEHSKERERFERRRELRNI